MNKTAVLVLAFGIIVAGAARSAAQEQPPQQSVPTAEEQEKQKADLEKKAYRLLDQVIDETQYLRLTENRVRVQINAADLIWDHNQPRARTLFALATDGINEMQRTAPTSVNQRGLNNQDRRAPQLRQELVLTVARHDAPLAYQLLAATRPVAPVTDPRNPRQTNVEENLEQNLLAQVARLDPKLAAQNAEQMLEKGQFPRSLGDVIAQLQSKDEDAATKLTEEMLKLLQSTNMLAN